MAMDRWNPFREMLALRDAMDRMFDESFFRSALPAGSGGRASTIPLDLAETDQGFVIRAALPGIKPEDVQITVHGDTLTIRGESKAQEERKEQNWIIREWRSGAFQRMVQLPAPVNPDQAQARFQDGMLELTLPKAEAARPRQIKVEGGGAQMGPGQPSAQISGGGTGDGARAASPGPGQGAPAAGTATQAPGQSDPVTKASEESFPTSDAPSWSPERT